MRSRSIALALGLTSLVGAAALACGTPDPGAYTLMPGHGASLTGPDNDSAAPIKIDAGAPADSGARKSKDGAIEDRKPQKETSTVEDSGPDPFGTAAYKSMPVATSASTLHQMKGGPNNPDFSMACLSCHDGSSKTTVEFLFAGSIYAAGDGGAGLSDIEVRVVDKKGNGVSAYSDDDGNFWATATATLDVPGITGARNSTSESTMPQALTTGDCNSCHDSKANPVITLE